MLRSLMCSLFLAAMAAGQSSFDVLAFPNASGFRLLGAAQVNNLVLQLTDPVPDQTGVVWSEEPVFVASGFDTTIRFRITAPAGARPAEGLALVIQNSAAGLNAMGGGREAIGYGSSDRPGIFNSLAIELVDLPPVFVPGGVSSVGGIHTNGPGENMEEAAFALREVPPPPRIGPYSNLADGLTHTVRVVYVPGTLEVFVNGQSVPELIVNYDFLTGGQISNGVRVPGLSLPNGTAYVGLSASTGQTLVQLTEIVSWRWQSTLVYELCGRSALLDAGQNPIDVLRINDSIGDPRRQLRIPTFDPLTFSLDRPQNAVGPANFLVFAAPVQATPPTMTAFGLLCFDPLALTGIPILDTFGVFAGLAPATPAPYRFTIPSGVPFPGQWIFQGVMSDALAPGGLSRINAIALEVFAAMAPTISSISPASGPAGVPVTISGSNISQFARLRVAGQPVTPSLALPNAITFPMPAMVACDTPVLLTNPDGQSTTATLNPTVVITSLSPASGPAAGGRTLTILAPQLGPGAQFTLGGIPITPTILVQGVARLITPALPPGPATLTITTPGGCVTNATFTAL